MFVPPHLRWSLRPTSSLLLLAYLSACTSWHTQNPGPEQAIAWKHPKEMRVKLPDGSSVVIRDPRVSGDSLYGTLARGPRAGQDYVLPLSEVQSVALKQINTAKTVALIAGLGTTVILVATAADASRWSGGGGSGGGGGGGGGSSGEPIVSCPLVYSWDGSDWRLDSGTFGGAITRALTRTDVDNLVFARPVDGRLRLRVANELNETDYVDALSVLAVDHPQGTEVAPDGAGKLYTVGPLVTPSSAHDFAGKDALPRLRSADGWSWESSLIPRDTARADATRDGVVLTFPKPAAAGAARLVVDGNNTPWAAYMLQVLVSAHGRSTQAWFDSLDASPELARALGQRLAREAFLAVSVWTGDRWESRGLIWEAGPEVVKRQVLPLDLRAIPGDSVRIRLESPPAFWLLDQVAMDYSEEQPIEVRELSADSQPNVVAPVFRLLGKADGEALKLETGDAVTLEFAAPREHPGLARSYLLRSTGWYRVHTPEHAEPDVALLSRLLHEPGAISRVATSRLNDALRPLAGRLP